VLALTYCKSMLVVPRVIISSHGDSYLESSFYSWFFISSHCFKKYFKYKNKLFHNYFLVPKTLFITSHKLIFSFLVTFQQFQVLSRKVLQLFGKILIIVVLGSYQRFSQLFFINFSTKCYIMVTYIQKV
jgi:hypothetical protein